jgi:predicted nucleotidyltransferase
MSAFAGDIIRYVDQVANRFKPERIVLFGSHAYGSPNGDSDVDILVVSNKRYSHHAQAFKIRLAVDAPFPLDLIVRSEREIERRIGMNDFFLAEIVGQGIVLYDATNPGVGAKGRSRLRRRLAVAAIA